MLACLIPFIGIGWALFLIIMVEAAMIIWNKRVAGKISFNQESSLLATYYAAVLAAISLDPWLGLMGYIAYQAYDMVGQIYLQLKCTFMKI
jgi:hypothetical protein